MKHVKVLNRILYVWVELLLSLLALMDIIWEEVAPSVPFFVFSTLSQRVQTRPDVVRGSPEQLCRPHVLRLL